MKNLLFVFFILNLSYGQLTTVEGVYDFYKSEIPINLNEETTVIDVSYNKQFFTFTYKLHKKRERLKSAKVVLKMILSNQLSEAVNSLEEFLTIRGTNRNLLFLYCDQDSKPTFTVVYSVNSLNEYQRNESIEDLLEIELIN